MNKLLLYLIEATNQIKDIYTLIDLRTNAASLTTPASVINTAPIPGSGTTAVFTTTLAAIKTKFPATAITPSADPYTPRELAFIFLVTLDDNTQIVTQQVRARIVP